MLRDDFGHKLRVETIEGTAPCRHCLRIAQPDERMILLSYRPFAADIGPYSEVGPIFIHAHECERYPETSEIPPDFTGRDLVIRAYDHRHSICGAVVARAGTVLDRAAELLAGPDAAYVHARHTTYTCFDFQIERSGARVRSRTSDRDLI